MSKYCIFCQIARKEKRESYVYEDDRVIAVLDIRPVNEGHTLVMPRKHYEDIHEIHDDEVAHLFKIVKKMATAVKKVTKADGISIIQNNGRAAGQEVFHIHVHIIPRYEGQISPRATSDESKEKLDEIAEKIREHL